jgi:hypothetical protein
MTPDLFVPPLVIALVVLVVSLARRGSKVAAESAHQWFSERGGCPDLARLRRERPSKPAPYFPAPPASVGRTS